MSMKLLQATQNIGLWITCTGQILPSAYGRPIVFPPNTNGIIKIISSAVGGNLVWLDNSDNVFFKTLIAGKEYPIINIKTILASANDWQGIARINTVTDLEFMGE